MCLTSGASGATHPEDPKEERAGFSLEKDTGKVKGKNRTHSPRKLPFLAAHRMKSLTCAGYMRRRVSRLESWQ